MEVVVATAIGGIILLTLASLLSVTDRTKIKMERLDWLQQLRIEMFRTLSTRRAWENTLAHPANTSFACIRNRTSCSGQGSDILLVTTQGQPFDRSANPATPANGLDQKGNPCSTFNSTGSPDCPFRYALRWDALCESPSCEQYQVKLTARLLYAPGNAASLAALNVRQYDFTIFKDESTPSIENLCAAAGGNFDISSGTCILAADASCDFPFMLVGFTAQGRKMCGQYVPVRCPVDMVLTAVNPNNRTVTCSPACDGGVAITLPFGELAP